MNEQRKLKTWLIQFEKELTNYFDKKETDEILTYYEEMVNDKLDEGRDIDEVLSSYEPKKLAKQLIPQVLSKRAVKSKDTSHNAWLVVLILFSSPILIPLGIVYISLMIVAASLVISGGAVIIGGAFSVIMYLFQVFTMGLAAPELFVSIGMGLIAFSILSTLGYFMFKISWYIFKQLAIWFSRLIVRKRENYENI
ncbi:MAG: DUF1700 domain-containing protein [Acholeplasmataceae bacterium]